MRLSITLFFLFFTFSIQAQNYSKDQVLEDLDFMAINMKKYNPGLQQFNPSFDSVFQEIRKEVNGNYNALAHFKIMARVAALAKEGHMKLGNWSDTIHNGFNQDRYKFLPFQVKLINEELFIWKIYSQEEEINDGDKILTINGKTSKEIISEIRTCLLIDSDIESNFIHQLNNGFAFLYYLYMEQSPFFEIEYSYKGQNNIAKTQMKALNKTQMSKNYKIQYGLNKDRKTEQGNSVYYFDLKKDRATLVLKSFNRSKLKKEKVKSKKFYKSIFEELKEKNIRNLTIDLRGNTGGRIEMAEDILPYIIKEDSSLVFRTSVSWKGKRKEFELPEKSELAFTGKIYVLVDGQTFSAGSSIARYLREFGGAIIIGEEGGGRYEGFVAGSIEYLELPQSELEIGIPRYSTLFPPSSIQKTKDRGIMPDFKVNYSLEDLIQEKDLAMEKLNEILGKS